jgi:hypothetical protein
VLIFVTTLIGTASHFSSNNIFKSIAATYMVAAIDLNAKTPFKIALSQVSVSKVLMKFLK